MAKPDFVREFLSVVAQTAPIDTNTSRRIEGEIRKLYGGQEVKIRSRPPIDMSVIDAGLRQRKSVSQIAAEQGVDRSTIYRHLSKNCRRSRPD